ncbi:hypothetical protein HAX54_012704 [Datura stramonium]|uniref:Uncharacterized protein n=1 Tax=Datura stramonium TaxID=4076 RepID=A0ABS8TM06_DATST|nr:hypothetical protein [Datura stramonium]
MISRMKKKVDSTETRVKEMRGEFSSFVNVGVIIKDVLRRERVNKEQRFSFGCLLTRFLREQQIDEEWLTIDHGKSMLPLARCGAMLAQGEVQPTVHSRWPKIPIVVQLGSKAAKLIPIQAGIMNA